MLQADTDTMVREYKWKSTSGSFGKEAFDAAVEKVHSGEMSKRKASVTYGVLRKTLNRHLSGAVKIKLGSVS
jgi:helix-turn-helix, Psq domain